MKAKTQRVPCKNWILEDDRHYPLLLLVVLMLWQHNLLLYCQIIKREEKLWFQSCWIDALFWHNTVFHKLLLATEHPCVHVIIPVLVHRALLLKFFWLLFVALSTLQCGRQDVKNILWKSTILSSTQEQKNSSSNLTAYCLNVFGVSRQPKSPLALKSFYWLRIKLIRPRSFQENKLPSAINRLAIMLMGDCSYGDHMRLKLSWSQAFVYGRFYPPEEAK